jgi:polyisoprenoid-binding protein YceI
MSKLKWVLAGVVALAVAISAGTFAYIHFVSSDAPPPLSFSDITTTTGGTNDPAGLTTTAPATAGGVDGAWQATSASVVGYRVNEVLFGQTHEAAGRTNAVTGTMTIDGSSVTQVALQVDMTKVASDESRRDAQFQGRIMDTASFPTATFTLTQPFALPSIPTDSTPVTVTATGDLTLHGTTNGVTVELQARRNGSNIEVNGTIPIVFADYGIPNPSFAGVVTTEDHGVLELLVVFAPAT